MTSPNGVLKTILSLVMMTDILGNSLDLPDVQVFPDQNNPKDYGGIDSTQEFRIMRLNATCREGDWIFFPLGVIRLNCSAQSEFRRQVVEECCEEYSESLPGYCVGHCTESNECKCRPGYSASDSNTCQSICTQACTNGYCSAPNKCTCNTGYIEVSDGVCEPYCPNVFPSNAYCAEPNTFNCIRGYNRTWKNGSIECRPFCDKECYNSQCVAPDKCRCNGGYSPRENASHICDPVSTLHCINGENTNWSTYKIFISSTLPAKVIIITGLVLLLASSIMIIYLILICVRRRARNVRGKYTRPAIEPTGQCANLIGAGQPIETQAQLSLGINA